MIGPLICVGQLQTEYFPAARSARDLDSRRQLDRRRVIGARTPDLPVRTSAAEELTAARHRPVVFERDGRVGDPLSDGAVLAGLDLRCVLRRGRRRQIINASSVRHMSRVGWTGGQGTVNTLPVVSHVWPLYNYRLHRRRRRLPEMLTSNARVDSTSSLPDGARTAVTRRQIITLLAILTFGLGVRLTALVNALHSPGYSWQDPDGYMTQAIRLGGRDGWTWTFDAVTYTINGQRHALPPMYSVFLSMFALWPGFPLSAQVAQVGLAVVSIALVFALGRCVHSTRAGLVAASLYALWVPNIFNVWSTSQETLYVPIILTAFLLLARAVDRDDPWPGFALAGVVFGAAALTRSMPMFFAVPAAITHVLLARNRRRAAVQGLTFLLGFLLLTAPYSAALSRHFGQLTIIDTHGSIHLESASGARAPSLFETAQGLWRAMSARPSGYFAECVARARSLLHVNGGRILQIYVVADSKIGAVVWKSLVHLGSDALLVMGTMLAGLGAALCRRPRLAIFLLLWAALDVAIASVGGFGGARLRAPFEPFLVVLAAIVFVGEWR